MARQKKGAQIPGELLSFTHTKILTEDKDREDGVLREQEYKPPSAKTKFAQAIMATSRLSPGQKEQALYFLCGPVYAKDGYVIARNYVRLCTGPDYAARGKGALRGSFRGAAGYP
ncbi:MAG TPA: hypothetical protein V6D33_11845 [Cyanophyceae cyanobacterium]